MKLVYTEQALASLNESLELIAPKVSHEKFIEIRDRILDQADTPIWITDTMWQATAL